MHATHRLTWLDAGGHTQFPMLSAGSSVLRRLLGPMDSLQETRLVREMAMSNGQYFNFQSKESLLMCWIFLDTLLGD